MIVKVVFAQGQLVLVAQEPRATVRLAVGQLLDYYASCPTPCLRAFMWFWRGVGGWGAVDLQPGP